MLTPFTMAAIVAEVILGFLTFTGSLMAAGKLQEIKWIPQRPVTYQFQNESNFALLGVGGVCAVSGIDPAASRMRRSCFPSSLCSPWPLACC